MWDEFSEAYTNNANYLPTLSGNNRKLTTDWTTFQNYCDSINCSAVIFNNNTNNKKSYKDWDNISNLDEFYVKPKIGTTETTITYNTLTSVINNNNIAYYVFPDSALDENIKYYENYDEITNNDFLVLLSITETINLKKNIILEANNELIPDFSNGTFKTIFIKCKKNDSNTNDPEWITSDLLSSIDYTFQTQTGSYVLFSELDNDDNLTLSSTLTLNKNNTTYYRFPIRADKIQYINKIEIETEILSTYRRIYFNWYKL